MRCNLTEAEQKAALAVPFRCTGEEQEFIERCFIGYLFFEHEADENGRLGVTTECTRCGRRVWWTEREWKRFKQENNVKAKSDLLCPDCGCGVTLYPRGRLRSGNTLDEYRQVVLLRAIDGALRAVALSVWKHHGRWESDDAEGCVKAAYYYMVYCLGQWGVTGKTVFNGKAVAERLTYVEKQGWHKRGYFAYTLSPDDIHISEWHWEDDENGPVTIYSGPAEGRPYVVGGDTAGDGSDYFVGQVLDNITGRQVCVLRHRYDEDTYARQMYCLGRYYNDALLGIETNFSTYPVKLLALMGYPKLYVREVEDDYTGRIKQAYGFQTNRTTRPVILSELIRILRESMASINDRDTLLEMLTFVRREKDLQGEAESGAHDDCVLALAIAHYIRPQQTMEIKRPRGERVRWSQDLWDDYNKAAPAEREAMLRLWGRPE